MDVDQARDLLTRSPEAWLPGIAGSASERGERLLAEVGFGDDPRVAKHVEIGFGTPISLATGTILPMHWVAAGPRGLFPDLNADLEVAPLGTHQTQLSMSARYVPPLGSLGRVIDRAVMHRVAEATLKDFIDRVAEAMLVEASEGHVLAG